MSSKSSDILLGVNIDHVATLRQARGGDYPDPTVAAVFALEGGADSITLHLREDRRHIQDSDLYRLKLIKTASINLEMAVTEEMIAIAEEVKPNKCCLVPEKRAELTTEGGLDVAGQEENIRKACRRLTAAGIEVSLFIDPDIQQIEAAKRCAAPVVELTTGQYAEAKTAAETESQLLRIQTAAQAAHQLGLIVNAGHGLRYDNVGPIAAIDCMHELNIGHSIISFSVFWGLETAVKKMKQQMQQARSTLEKIC